jgi:chromosome segregation ATPase
VAESQAKAEALRSRVERLKSELSEMATKALAAQPAASAATPAEVQGKADDASSALAQKALQDRVQMLNTMRVKIEARMRDIGQEIREIQIKLATDGGSVSSKLGVKERELAALVDRKIDQEIDAERSRETYQRLTKAAEQKAELPEIARAVRADEYVRELRRRLDDVEIRRDVLTGKGIAKENPSVAELKSEIDAVRKKLDNAKAEAAAELRAQLLADSKNQLDSTQRRFEATSRRVELLKSDLGDLSNQALNLSNKLDEQRQLREQLITTKQQIEQLMAEQSLRPGK